MDTLRQDFSYALRILGKERAYSAAVVLTLAVCLGANTAIFTVVRSVLLRPLPYPQPERLISSYDSFPGAGVEREGTRTGWGVNLSGWIKTIDKDRVTGQIVYGEGIASYMNDGGVDIAPNASFRAATVPTLGAFLYYDHYWSEKWSSSIGGSIHRQDNTGNQDDKAFRQGSYASTNLLWYPARNVIAGGELLWGRLELKDGKTFNDTRVQFSGQYKF